MGRAPRAPLSAGRRDAGARAAGAPRFKTARGPRAGLLLGRAPIPNQGVGAAAQLPAMVASRRHLRAGRLGIGIGIGIGLGLGLWLALGSGDEGLGMRVRVRFRG